MVHDCSKKIYFASPFFNDVQVEREERLKKKLRDIGYIVWSPKENCVCPPDADDKTRTNTFLDNLNGIIQSHIVFVVTDGKDVGTIWEAGYSFAMNKVIVYYCETLGGGQFNLMLAESGDVVLTDFSQIDMLPELLKTGKKYVGPIE